jgi:hypothetical protein
MGRRSAVWLKRPLAIIEPVAVNVLVAGSNNSELDRARAPAGAPALNPPLTSTFPEARAVAPWNARMVVSDPVSEKLLVTGSNTSALPSAELPPEDSPPVMRTFPDARSVPV